MRRIAIGNLVLALAFVVAMFAPPIVSAEGPIVSSASFLEWDYDVTVTTVDHFAIYLERAPGIIPDGTPTAIVAFPILEWPIVAATGQWYAVITAVTTFGTESAPSNELPFVVDVIPAGPVNLRIK